MPTAFARSFAGVVHAPQGRLTGLLGALSWLTHSHGSFQPDSLVGRIIPLSRASASPLPRSRVRTTPTQASVPTFGNCLAAVLTIKQCFAQGDPVEQKLHMLANLLPVLTIKQCFAQGDPVEQKLHMPANLLPSICCRAALQIGATRSTPA